MPSTNTNGRSRDSWCTPRWLADALGRFDLDPCSNPHANIHAAIHCSLEDGENGLLDGDDGSLECPRGWFYSRNPTPEFRVAEPSWRVFINPPYSRGQVERWVDHYKYTDFTFLLRWDPSTRWFKKLYDETKYVWFPNRRINFEPPPGVTASSNPFPHALFLKSYPPSGLEGLGYLVKVDDQVHWNPE